jgi:hypothetical protein
VPVDDALKGQWIKPEAVAYGQIFPKGKSLQSPEQYAAAQVMTALLELQHGTSGGDYVECRKAIDHALELAGPSRIFMDFIETEEFPSAFSKLGCNLVEWSLCDNKMVNR